ncbi:hypothetical protein ACQKWADRAFT_255515 [Trichoderma austrokoningii]
MLSLQKPVFFQVPRISWHHSFCGASRWRANANCISGLLRLKSLDTALHTATSRVLVLHRSRIREGEKLPTHCF